MLQFLPELLNKFKRTGRTIRNAGEGRKLRAELLEDRRLLAIVWTNQGNAGNDSDRFEATYGQVLAPVARDIVRRAIDDWNAIISDFNFDGDSNPLTTNSLNNTYSLDVFGDTLTGTGRGETNNILFSSARPYDAIITLDDNGGGDGWFFDQTPLDDAEFTGIANAFQSSFVDASTNDTNYDDFPNYYSRDRTRRWYCP